MSPPIVVIRVTASAHPMPPITLTTDFGDSAGYVAQMKGVLACLAPDTPVVDISHQVPAQHVRCAALWLSDTVPWFPDSTVHLGVVDPGVGTKRRILAGRIRTQLSGEEARTQYFVGPDNGLFSLLSIQEAVSVDVGLLPNRPVISATFHGRDIMAPAAAMIAKSGRPEELGEHVSDWVTLDLPGVQICGALVTGAILYADSFGNLITNITEADLSDRAESVIVLVGKVQVKFVRTYGQADSGDLVALVGSSGRLEIAVSGGSAADRIDIASPIGVIRR